MKRQHTTTNNQHSTITTVNRKTNKTSVIDRNIVSESVVIVDDGKSSLEKFTKFSFISSVVILSMICMFGSIFFTGAFNSAYASKSSSYTYFDYNHTARSTTAVTYDWTNKINQLSALVPIFTLPTLNIEDSVYRTPDNANRFIDYYTAGFIYYDSSEVESQTIRDINLHHQLGFIPIYNYPQRGVYKFNEYNEWLMDEMLYTSAYNWWQSQGQFIEEYFNYNNGNIEVRSDYYNSPVLSFSNFIACLFSPLLWTFNFFFDLGVFFNFMINW